ncbi:MAG: hypothetical protein PUP90_20145 [Nostoc sp. S4]|nr:hypothetical protein [Nostoc sp. S4]
MYFAALTFHLPSIFISEEEALKQQIQASYKVPVAGILPVCEEMFHLGSSDIFCLRYPEHSWTKTVSTIAQHLSESNKLINQPFQRAKRRDRVINLAKDFANSERLQSLDWQVEAILDEQISEMIQQAESEVKNPIRNQLLRSLLARRLCYYLKSRNT